MDEPQLKAVLIANVTELMRRSYGKTNVTRLGKDTGISTGGAQRLLHPNQSVGIEVLERVADFFKVQPWQLFAPKLGESLRLSEPEMEAIRKMREPIQPAIVPDVVKPRRIKTS